MLSAITYHVQTKLGRDLFRTNTQAGVPQRYMSTTQVTSGGDIAAIWQYHVNKSIRNSREEKVNKVWGSARA